MRYTVIIQQRLLEVNSEKYQLCNNPAKRDGFSMLEALVGPRPPALLRSNRLLMCSIAQSSPYPPGWHLAGSTLSDTPPLTRHSGS